jgi:hypothetical protein
MIFMLSFFYIFKYGKDLAQFLYNSAEIKIIPLAELRAGVYLNKDYIRQILGSRNNFENMKNELSAELDETERLQLENLLKSRQDKDKKWYQLISIFRNLRMDSLPTIIQQIIQYRKQVQQEKLFLNKFKEKLNDLQMEQLDDILHNLDDVSRFLKTIKGKLTDKHAEELKTMIEKRNKEVIDQGLAPIDKIILHKTFSFAPFMLLGVIITLLTKSSLIHLIYQLLGR